MLLVPLSAVFQPKIVLFSIELGIIIIFLFSLLGGTSSRLLFFTYMGTLFGVNCILYKFFGIDVFCVHNLSDGIICTSFIVYSRGKFFSYSSPVIELITID